MFLFCPFGGLTFNGQFFIEMVLNLIMGQMILTELGSKFLEMPAATVSKQMASNCWYKNLKTTKSKSKSPAIPRWLRTDSSIFIWIVFM